MDVRVELWRRLSAEELIFLNCGVRLLRVPWTARRSNQSILKEISTGCSLEGLILRLKLQYLGHLMQRADSLEKTLMLGKIEGRGRRGQQRMRWLDGITDSMDMSLKSSRSWWWTGKTCVVQLIRLQWVRHDWTEGLMWLDWVYLNQFSSVQSLSRVRLFATPETAALQASLSITNSRSPPKSISIELVMPSNPLFSCHPLLLLPSDFPSIRVFSNESALCIRWPKDWSFSFEISPTNEHLGLISFRMDWLNLLAVQGTLKSLL